MERPASSPPYQICRFVKKHRGAAWPSTSAAPMLNCDNSSPNLYATSASPNVSSLSMDDGVFTCGYSLYRDLTLRDAHMDVALRWQAAYLSPNEGGSGASAPLFLDFCTACLGRDALAVLAAQEPYEDPEPDWSLLPSKRSGNSLPSKETR